MSNEEIIDEMKHCYDNLILIDCGSNLINKKYARDLDSVMKRAKDSGMLNYEINKYLYVYLCCYTFL